jgi:PKD repeat protein
MNLRTPSLVLTMLAIAGNGSFAQEVAPCGANDLHHFSAAERAQVAQADAELEAFTAAWASEQRGGGDNTITIPVVFHIIHNNGPENISDEQVFDAMRVLNDDFNRLNDDWDNVRPEFLPIVADVGITFALAKKDPNGNCTKGITRTVSPLTNQGDQEMKELIQWPRNKYLNVWVAASAAGAAGYTYRPGAVNNWAAGDGIVLLHDYTGSIGTGSPSRSRTLTHEVGHWINLAHCWGNTNEPGLDENCSEDDGVADTPNTKGWTACVLSGASCGSPLDNVENYMEYSYCSKMFTEGQKTRMLAALNSSTAQRNSLWTASNLAATGVSSEPVLCAAEFVSSGSLVCAGSTVTFTDVSFHGVTSRTWNFPGGEPASSTDAAPSVTYAQPGTYQVQLTVSDGSTTLTSNQNVTVTVLPNPGMPAPFAEGFESLTSLNGPEWFTVNATNDNTFNVTSTAAYTGSSSVRMVNTAAMDGTVDELLSRTYDLTDMASVTISFRYAFARRNNTNDDVLTLYVSNNCGELWALRKIMRGSTTLTTAPNTSGNFVPTAEQWNYAEVTNISPSYFSPDFRFKFQFESDGGNNLYIDDINLNGMPVGVEELSAGANNMLVMPNPATDAAQVVFGLRSASRVELEMTDAMGRLVQRTDLGLRPAGDQRAAVDLMPLAPGTYAVRRLTNDGTSTVRLVVE